MGRCSYSFTGLPTTTPFKKWYLRWMDETKDPTATFRDSSWLMSLSDCERRWKWSLCERPSPAKVEVQSRIQTKSSIPLSTSPTSPNRTMPPHSSLRVANYATASKPSSAPAHAPAPRPYAPPKERISRHPHYPDPEPAQPVKQKSLFSRLWPFKSTPQEQFDYSKRDPARGVEASRRVVKEGVLDPRYKRTASNVMKIMAFTPVAIFLSWELYQRRFGGREQKQFPMHKTETTQQAPKTLER